MITKRFLSVLSTVAVLLIGSGLLTQSMAKESVQAVTYSPHADYMDCHMNMGPTGAKAWMRGYHFQVLSIDQGSPAEGELKLGDVVVAANGRTFGPDADPRITLGNAIGEAEASGKPLKLKVFRNNRRKKVAINLPVLGGYSATWPAACEKSATILDAACQQLLNAQMPDGQVITDGEMGTFLTGLLLLASDNPKYLDGARRAAYRALEVDYENMSYNNWPMGYGGLLLAEYYLATGDDTVLPVLEELADALAEGQMKSGSWGHKSPGEGYGALNQPGVVCAITLVLAQECGIDVDQQALQKTLDFFGRYAMLGCVPYGDHGPGGAPDSNGRSASAGILMHLAGREPEAKAFVNSVAMSYWMREQGHTGGFFSLTWGPLAAALAGPEKLQTFMDYQRWYYNLARTWEGDLVLLPYKEALTRFDHSGYIYSGGDFTSGGMGLAFALPQKHLRILGAPKSVFSPHSPLEGQLLAARTHYLEREWEACDKILATMAYDELGSERERAWLDQLRAARENLRVSTERILLEVDSNLVEGAAYRASQQYQALKRRLGEEGDERFGALEERLSSGSNPWYIREGEQYYEAWRKLRGYAVRSWVPQGGQAKMLIEGLPTLRQPIWEALSPTSQITAQSWRTLLLEKGAELPRNWEQIGFDDSNWRLSSGIFIPEKRKDKEKEDAREDKEIFPEGPVGARRVFEVENTEGVALRVRLQTVRRSKTRIYLNGELIVNAVRGQRGGYAAIELDDASLNLLNRGANLLAVTSTKQGRGNNHLDVGVEINRRRIEKRTLPVHRADTLFMSKKPAGDFTLRVRETRDEMLQGLQDRYDRKPVAELLAELSEAVPFSRTLAENALVGKGLAGIKAAVEAAGHSDWKVRSAVCNVINKGRKKHKDEEQSEELAYLKTQVPVLAGMLEDEHFWVRTRAASALAGFGEAAQPAVPALLERVQDSEEWVRIAAVRAVRSVHENPEVAVAAALQALNKPGTAYGAPRNALTLLEEYPDIGDGRLKALLNLLRHPPEGGGGRFLNQAMDMAAALDPEGEQLIPVLIEIASDTTHYSRQRANPRGKAIELLGSYGDKASEALPVLEEILSSKEKSEKQQHDAAKQAISQITGSVLEAANNE